MDWAMFLSSTVLGIVEGLTEFLPVSSTGHLIVAGDLMAFTTPGAETFFIAIQAGAILAVCWECRARVLQMVSGFFLGGPGRRLAIHTLVAFFPAVVVGVLASEAIKAQFFNPWTVAVALVAGGLLIFWVESLRERGRLPERVRDVDEIDWKCALGIGAMQCLAMIPGTSRSGATIIGSMALGLSRPAATEFSFYLAIPTILGASVWDLWSSRDALSVDTLPWIAWGTAVSFVVAVAVVRWFLRYVSGHDFRAFGWYRIGFGLLLMALSLAGAID